MNLTAKRLIAGLAVFFFMLISIAAEASEFGDLQNKLNTARETLTTMIQNPNKRGPDQQKLVKESADAVSAALAKIKVPADKEPRFKKLVETWGAFKKTREEQLVPLLVSGKQDEAVKIASGVQAERYGKMITLCEELGY